MTDENIKAPRPEPGPGYRLLEPHEAIEPGDEWAYAEETPGGWTLVTDDVGSTPGSVSYREREVELHFRRALTPYERLMVASTDHAPRGPVLGVRLASGEFLPDPELTEAVRLLREAWLAAGDVQSGALPLVVQELITAAGTVSECAVWALAPDEEGEDR